MVTIIKNSLDNLEINLVLKPAQTLVERFMTNTPHNLSPYYDRNHTLYCKLII